MKLNALYGITGLALLLSLNACSGGMHRYDDVVTELTRER